MRRRSKKVPVPPDNLSPLVDRLLRRDPARTGRALTGCAGTWTWPRLLSATDQAAGLLAASGVRPGQIVAGQLPRTGAHLALLLGCLRSGVGWMPLNARATPREIREQTTDAGAVAVWLPEAADPSAVPVGARHLPAEALAAEIDRAAPHDGPPPSADAAGLVCTTSGTTGRPKVVVSTHRMLAATLSALHDAWGWSADDVLLHALPLDHIHGVVVAQLGALWAGARSHWLEAFDADAAFRAVREERITVMMGVPTFYHRMLTLPAERAADLATLRLATCGSAPLAAATHRAFRDRFGVDVLERYGMTEVGIVLSNPLHGPRHPGAVGTPLPGVEARIEPLESTDEPIGSPGRDAAGELLIRGASVFDGYLRVVDGERHVDRSCFTPEGWMRTGDLASVAQDVYRIVGRLKDMILTGGSNVYPAEVEAVLAAHPDVVEVAVFGVPDADLGEQPVAAVVPGPAGLDRTALVAWARARLAPYKAPRAVAVCDELPRNRMGKVLKHALVADWARPSCRRGRLGDAPALVVGNLAMAQETEGVALDVATVTAGVEAVFAHPDRGTWWVAEQAGRIVGQTLVTREWSDWRNAYVCWIQSVHVAPDARGAGIFRLLATTIEREARASGAAGLRLYVDQRNEQAMAVYRRLEMDGDHYRVFERMFS